MLSIQLKKSMILDGCCGFNSAFMIMKMAKKIRKTPEGKLQAARGQARIQDIKAIHTLTKKQKTGWLIKVMKKQFNLKVGTVLNFV
ncbi:hypothetical protein [Acinetobacter baumannii]|uniref:hypothetical protein n=1 Tax=Acinetobacter baumannii TaxID=470 RepID=UPI00254A92A7|nr:hypothetical protein [Acinetobacter baumannii]